MPKHQIGVNLTQGAKLNDSDNQRRRSEERQSRDHQRDTNEFSAAMSRLEKAVQELVTATTGEITDRATSLLDETSKRIESEVRLKKVEDAHPEEATVHERRRKRHRARHTFEEVRRKGELYIDPSEEKVAGVCAALARYFGVETWIVRMGALTGLIFVPGVVFPAYWIAYFVMEKRTDGERGKRRRRRRRSRRHSRRGAESEVQMSHEEFDAEMANDTVDASGSDPDDPDPKFSPGKSLRRVTTDMTQAELRLRRLESFVTSDRYELHRELAKIEKDGATS